MSDGIFEHAFVPFQRDSDGGSSSDESVEAINAPLSRAGKGRSTGRRKRRSTPAKRRVQEEKEMVLLLSSDDESPTKKAKSEKAATKKRGKGKQKKGGKKGGRGKKKTGAVPDPAAAAVTSDDDDVVELVPVTLDEAKVRAEALAEMQVELARVEPVKLQETEAEKLGKTICQKLNANKENMARTRSELKSQMEFRPATLRTSSPERRAEVERLEDRMFTVRLAPCLRTTAIGLKAKRVDIKGIKTGQDFIDFIKGDKIIERKGLVVKTVEVKFATGTFVMPPEMSVAEAVHKAHRSDAATMKTVPAIYTVDVQGDEVGVDVVSTALPGSLTVVVQAGAKDVENIPLHPSEPFSILFERYCAKKGLDVANCKFTFDGDAVAPTAKMADLDAFEEGDKIDVRVKSS